MFKLVLVLFLSFLANATELQLVNGKIKAHTEVFGDSTIDPETTNIKTKVKKADSFESLNGEFTINSMSLVSDNKDRDKHMYEVLKVLQAPTISFYITSLEKVEDKYKINGILKINHIRRNISSMATISSAENIIEINGDFSIKLTDFGLEPPTMFFLTVRDQVDINYNFNFSEGI